MLWISLWDSLSISSWGNSTSFKGCGGVCKEIKQEMKVRNESGQWQNVCVIVCLHK